MEDLEVKLTEYQQLEAQKVGKQQEDVLKINVFVYRNVCIENFWLWKVSTKLQEQFVHFQN